MTRTAKHNDPPTHGTAAHGQGHSASIKQFMGAADDEGAERQSAPKPEILPKYFGKSGFVDANPNEIKKGGAGKGNWGKEGDELEDVAQFETFRKRRGSNAQSAPKDFTSKFEEPDDDDVIDERPTA